MQEMQIIFVSSAFYFLSTSRLACENNGKPAFSGILFGCKTQTKLKAPHTKRFKVFEVLMSPHSSHKFTVLVVKSGTVFEAPNQFSFHYVLAISHRYF